MVSPDSGSMIVGTVERGVRSDAVKNGRREAFTRGGDDDMIWVEDVGTGVGYIAVIARSSRATRFWGRGRGGDELNGSKAGSREAGRLIPAAGAFELLLGGEDSMMGESA